jgi:hypothetical protein
MANIFDYLAWRGDLDFKRVPFNPVDNIIFSQLSYLPLDGIVPGLKEKASISIARTSEIFSERLKENAFHDRFLLKDDPAFVEALGRASRFRDCELHSFVNLLDIAQEKQFAAVSINTGIMNFIAYRGTDVSLVGWKEDFNMSFSETVPAQQEAVSYLEGIAAKKRGPLWIGGHSKGGNLAIYAAASCRKAIRHRIARVYSNDAPGFHGSLIASEGFRKIRNRIFSFVPQFSIVGMLFKHGSEYTVIKSSSTGLMQHDLYTWEVTHKDLVRMDSISRHSHFVNDTLKEWGAGLDYERRQQLIEALYTILNGARIESIAEIEKDWFKTTGRMIQSLGSIDESTRDLMFKTIRALFDAMRNNLDTLKSAGKTPLGKG